MDRLTERSIYNLNARKSPKGASVGAMGSEIYFSPLEAAPLISKLIKRSWKDKVDIWREGQQNSDSVKIYIAKHMSDQQWLCLVLTRGGGPHWQLHLDYEDQQGNIKVLGEAKAGDLLELLEVIATLAQTGEDSLK